jgi:hypothetical protein
MKYVFKKLVVCFSMVATIAGCVAVWGSSYKIIEKNDSGITFQYDTALNSSAMMQKMASIHCEKFDKKAEVLDAKMPGLLLGIIEEKYACVEH